MLNKILSVTLLLSFFANISFADCDWTKIKKNEDSTFIYSKELHICVGEMKQSLEIAEKQILNLSKALELKDLAIQKSEERANFWMDTAYKQADRANKIAELNSTNNALYFGGGIGLTLLSIWGASQLIKR